MNRKALNVFIFAYIFPFLSPSCISLHDEQMTPPSKGASKNDAKMIDQAVAYSLMVAALLITYLVH
ncbi:Arabinogalactan protein 16/20/22/41 [Dioscorea alata]|uniref:Arabinogalactan protein 16/20/22/41 n=1 Tax=Dioscorea alata TaxID=55571 RepID=A0ACB7W2R5_DIOAL|nr:Arabinogalactan protein 16/20/22/41 [Dioscorea alata]